MKHKIRLCEGENSPIFIQEMYKEKFIKSKIVNVQMKKKKNQENEKYKSNLLMF